MLKYLENQFLYEDKATVLEVFKNNDNQDIVILDSTIFYVKGGGQPADTGEITLNNIKFIVEDVRIIDNKIQHIGYFESSSFKAGDIVNLKIDINKREHHSRIHTLGHLIDEAIYSLGYSNNFIPDRGFHYPEGPSVTYRGKLENKSLEEFTEEVDAKLKKMIAEGFETKAFFINNSEVEKYCHKITVDPSIFDDSIKDLRVVIVWGNLGITCGGTHVKNINEIKDFSIVKITNKKGILKVSYQVA